MPPKMTNFDTWRNLYWADLSGQLWALNTIDNKYFDNTLLLKTDSTNGAWLWRWLVLFPSSAFLPPFPPFTPLLSHHTSQTPTLPNILQNH